MLLLLIYNTLSLSFLSSYYVVFHSLRCIIGIFKFRPDLIHELLCLYIQINSSCVRKFTLCKCCFYPARIPYHVVKLNIDIPQHFYLLLHFLLLLPGRARTTFLCVLTHSPYKSPDGCFFASLSCLLLYSLRQFLTSIN